jgi:hypothetical protein
MKSKNKFKEICMTYNVTVTLTKVQTPLANGIIFGHTNLSVTDAAGMAQQFSLNGSEATPWSVTVAGLADGVSNYSAQDVDSTGTAIGAAVTQSFTPVAATFPATSAITVAQA